MCGPTFTSYSEEGVRECGLFVVEIEAVKCSDLFHRVYTYIPFTR